MSLREVREREKESCTSQKKSEERERERALLFWFGDIQYISINIQCAFGLEDEIDMIRYDRM